MNYKEFNKGCFEEAKRLYKTANADQRYVLESLFPELKESEDEKIRKWLLDFVQGLPDEGLDFNFYNLSKKQVVAWLEKQGEIAEDLIAKKYLINKGYPIDTNGTFPTFEEMYNIIREGLEKQGEHKPTIEMKTPEESLGIDSETYNKIIDECIYGENKPDDNVEPKFKVGDWVVENGVNRNPVQITSFEEDKGSGIKVWFSNGTGTYIEFLKGYHKWTIQDAKDGDILFLDLMDGKTFIYNGTSPNMEILYSFIISNDGKDVLPYHIGKPNTGIGNIEESKNIIYPATKEQRSILFKRIKEAGYEWDTNTKELKKIEQEIIWSEKDDNKVKDIIYFLDTAKKHYASTVELDAYIDWLKSLKYLNNKHSYTFNEIDKEILNAAILFAMNSTNEFACNGVSKEDVIDWLKFFKDRIQPKTEVE